jgi:hypothetical protein
MKTQDMTKFLRLISPQNKTNKTKIKLSPSLSSSAHVSPLAATKLDTLAFLVQDDPNKVTADFKREDSTAKKRRKFLNPLRTGPSTVAMGNFSNCSPMKHTEILDSSIISFARSSTQSIGRRKSPAVPRLDLSRVFEVQQLQQLAADEMEMTQNLEKLAVKSTLLNQDIYSDPSQAYGHSLLQLKRSSVKSTQKTLSPNKYAAYHIMSGESPAKELVVPPNKKKFVDFDTIVKLEAESTSITTFEKAVKK